MSSKEACVAHILKEHAKPRTPKKEGRGTAPPNIALSKYWGKRNEPLHLPSATSLSIALKGLETHTTVSFLEKGAFEDKIFLNGVLLKSNSESHQKIQAFLSLFRGDEIHYFLVESTSAVPIGAGVASSAAGFAALALALDDLFQWQLPKTALSILARLGSGSAARSLWHGFVRWEKGETEEGMDSIGTPLEYTWPELCVGLSLIESKPKAIDSRAAMRASMVTSPFFNAFITQCESTVSLIEHAIQEKNFEALGEAAEQNALAMHAVIQSMKPSFTYWQPETLRQLQAVWALREEGVPIYATLDAGPNLKLLCLELSLSAILDVFPDLKVVRPFA